MLSLTARRPLAGIVATAALGALLAGASAAPAVTLDARITPARPAAGAPLTLTFDATFPAGAAGALTSLDVRLPRLLVSNGRHFPSVSTGVDPARGRFSGPPRASRIGHGTFRADITTTGEQGIEGSITVYNGPDGDSLAFHFYATEPLLISATSDAALTATNGVFGRQLTLYPLTRTPEGHAIELRQLEFTIDATYRRKPYFEAGTCPRSGRAPLTASFSFADGSPPATARDTLACRPAPRPRRGLPASAPSPRR